jgi:hypothetical protein
MNGNTKTTRNERRKEENLGEERLAVVCDEGRDERGDALVPREDPMSDRRAGPLGRLRAMRAMRRARCVSRAPRRASTRHRRRIARRCGRGRLGWLGWLGWLVFDSACRNPRRNPNSRRKPRPRPGLRRMRPSGGQGANFSLSEGLKVCLLFAKRVVVIRETPAKPKFAENGRSSR